MCHGDRGPQTADQVNEANPAHCVRARVHSLPEKAGVSALQPSGPYCGAMIQAKALWAKPHPYQAKPHPKGVASLRWLTQGSPTTRRALKRNDSASVRRSNNGYKREVAILGVVILPQQASGVRALRNDCLYSSHM